MAHNRDNFSARTIESLSKRVAYRCSNPACNKLTIGPSIENRNNSTTIGVAAHITAASPGGARYNKSLTPEQRSSIENGIWLCIECSTIIDKEPNSYSVRLLQQWKWKTEKKVRIEFEKTINQINYLKQNEQEQIENNSILVRKKFSGGEMGEMLETIGFNPLIMQLGNGKYKYSLENELTIYNTLNTPKLLLFSFDQHNALALIDSVVFHGNNRVFLTDKFTDSKIEFKKVLSMCIEHNKVKYSIVNNSKTPTLTSFKVDPISQGVLSNKIITPLYLIIAQPRYLTINYADIFIELLSINYIFQLFCDIKNVNWGITLKYSDEMSKSIGLPSTIFCFWVINGKIDEIPFIDIYFYKDFDNKIRVIPKIENENLEKILKCMIESNYTIFKEHSFNSLLMEYYHQNRL